MITAERQTATEAATDPITAGSISGGVERATLYYRGGFGLAWRSREVKWITWDRGQYAQYTNAVRLRWREQRQRKDRGTWITDGRAVIVAGWSNPQPPSSFETIKDDDAVTLRRGRFLSFDPAWDQEFDQWLADQDLPVLADFREHKAEDNGPISLLDLVKAEKQETPTINDPDAETRSEREPVLITPSNGSPAETPPATDTADHWVDRWAAFREFNESRSAALVDLPADPLPDFDTADLVSDYFDLVESFDYDDPDLVTYRTALQSRGYTFDEPADNDGPTLAEVKATADQLVKECKTRIANAEAVIRATREPEEADRIIAEHTGDQESTIRASRPREQSETIGTTEIAKAIRKRLSATFPGVQFYVRSKKYSMGSSIRVCWLDGPTIKQVKEITDQYDGSGFDGMIDLKYYRDHWLLPDGSAIVAYSGGTTGSRGCVSPVSNPKPAGARLVHFSCDGVSVSRGLSAEFLTKAADLIHSETGWQKPEIEGSQLWVSNSKAVDVARYKQDFDQLAPASGEARVLAHPHDRTMADAFDRRAHDLTFYEKPETPTAKETPTRKPAKESGSGKETGSGFDPDLAVVRVSGTWTWINVGKIQPPAAVCEALESLGFSWSFKRRAFFAKEVIDAETVRPALHAGDDESGGPESGENLGGELIPGGPSPKPAPAPAGTAPDPAKAEKLRETAESFDKQIKKKRSTFAGANLTHRRKGFIDAANKDADRMTEAKALLLAVADRWQAGDVPGFLLKLKSKKDAEQLARDVRSRAKYGDKYPTSYNDRTWGSWAEYNAAHTWAGRVLSGVETGDQDIGRKIERLTQEAQLSRLPGYFSTPRAAADQLLDHVPGFEPGEIVIEPSAGSGALADAIRDRFDGITLQTIEIREQLREILRLKGYDLIARDCLEYRPSVPYADAVIMNPPFEDDQAIEHVRHCFDHLLKDGGILISVMPAGITFSSNGKPAAFREWLDEIGGEINELPPGSFKESGTGVNACYVVIYK